MADRCHIAQANTEWERLAALHRSKTSSSSAQGRAYAKRYKGKEGVERFVYERSFFWFVHDVIFHPTERWRLGLQQFALCQFLQPVRDQLLSLGGNRDTLMASECDLDFRKDTDSRDYLVLCTRAFMKTGIIRCLPIWITTFRPRTRMSYARDTMEYAAAELSKMRGYYEYWEPVKKYWPHLHVTQERRRSPDTGRLRWSRKEADVPIVDGLDDSGDVVYGFCDTSEATIEAGGVESKPTGKRYHLVIHDDIVSAENCDTPAGRRKVRRFRNECVNVRSAGGINITLGTIHDPRDENAKLLHKALDTQSGTVTRKFFGVEVEVERDAMKPRLFLCPAWIEKEDGERELTYPEVLTWKELAIREESIGPKEFAMHYLLQPLTDEDNWFDISRIRLFDPAQLDDERFKESEDVYILCDPASRTDDKADDTAIVTLGRNHFGHVKVLRVQQGRWKEHEIMERLYGEWRYWTGHPVARHVDCYMENIAFIENMRQNINERANQFDPSFHVEPLKTNTRTDSKKQRMKSIEPIIYHRDWLFMAKPGVDITHVDWKDDMGVIQCIEDDQVPLYEDIRDAHGDDPSGGLEDDHRLDAASRIRQAMAERSDVPTTSDVRFNTREVRAQTVMARAIDRDIQTYEHSLRYQSAGLGLLN